MIGSLLGAGLGRYVASPVLKRLYPGADEERMDRAASMMGGLAGFAPGAYLMYKTYQNAGPKGWFGGLDNLNVPNKQTSSPATAKTSSAVDLRRRLAKSAAWGRTLSPSWTQPSIPKGTTQNTLDTAVANGTMGVYDAANVSQIMEEARPQGSGLISPASIARAAVSYGIGSLAGRALGATMNATFGSFSSGEQQNLARGFGAGNVLFDIMGRLSS